ncbi:MAG TPA: hypothetical protein PK250_08785 [Syntrophobacter fumaroxidans]|nr:hypothetical protein [Syntrophobacter fumaroxidans]
MNTARKMLILPAVFCLLVLTAGNALADYAWYNCTVVRVGQNRMGVFQITLARPGVTESRTFTLPADRTDRLLAIALSAVSANLRVRAYVDWRFEEGKVLKGLQAVGAVQ